MVEMRWKRVFLSPSMNKGMVVDLGKSILMTVE